MDACEAENLIAWIATQLEAWRGGGEPAESAARRLFQALNGRAAAVPDDLFTAPTPAEERPALRRAG